MKSLNQLVQALAYPQLSKEGTKDIYIKQIDDATVVVFNSDRAREILSCFPELNKYLEADNTMLVKDGAMSVNRWFIWALSHNLTVETQFPFIVKK